MQPTELCTLMTVETAPSPAAISSMVDAATADRAELVAQFERRTDPVATDSYCRESIGWILVNGQPTPDERRRLEAALARLP